MNTPIPPRCICRMSGCEIMQGAANHFSLYHRRMCREPGAWEWRLVAVFTDRGAAIRYLANEFATAVAI